MAANPRATKFTASASERIDVRPNELNASLSGFHMLTEVSGSDE
ncbi:MAG: hypothetical protein R3C42_08765 [Parvularculaceae bacterium]